MGVLAAAALVLLGLLLQQLYSNGADFAEGVARAHRLATTGGLGRDACRCSWAVAQASPQRLRR
jgi:hypothetical protein